ncbi:MAG TPA: glycosyl hydrolase family 43 [Prolixibacteraceae bacterium]|nr:glycosyl hydrolase family 43 [Prolixibacteraceae bacterium]
MRVETGEESNFCKRLIPCGRILEDPDYNVWCNSAIDGDDGKVHIFYSRWLNRYDHNGWIIDCEIAHAVADHAEGPYIFKDIVLDGSGTPDCWDAMTIHNPTIHKVDGRYVLIYIANRLGDVETTKIGMASADTLYGPWLPNPDNPIVDCGSEGEWDDVTADNPAFLKHPDGRFYIYYRSWKNRSTWKKGAARIDKVGVAIADKVEGPYIKHPENPVVDLTRFTDTRPVGMEDPYVYIENGKIYMITRDYGYFTGQGSFQPNGGLLFESDDGIHFITPPKIAFHEASRYFELTEQEKKLPRFGRFERPQVLMRNNKPAYLFAAIRGGRYNTSSGFVFKVI